jgi:hypothetical protein
MSNILWGPTGAVFLGAGVPYQGVEEEEPPPEPGEGVPDPENFSVFTNNSGGTITSFPLQQGRPFAQGEIPDYPQILVDGTPVTTQAHVEQRWPDDSVKHAVMFCIIATVADGASVTLSYQNQATGNTTGGLSAATVLASWDFDATMDLVYDEVTKSSSARTMLAAGHYTTNYSGTVATQFIIADHSAAATYDYGFGAYEEMRPIFHATFWPSTGQTKIRFINELANTTQLGSVTVDTITLKIGQASPETVFTQETPITQNMASRWTRPIESGGYWKGGTPTEEYTLNHNVHYLGKTKMLPAWDPAVSMTESAIAAKYSGYVASNRELYNAIASNYVMCWYKVWDDGAGRDDLGLYSGQSTYQLLTGGDRRMRKLALGSADIFAAFPVHFREGQYARSRPFDRNGSTDAGGKILSINTRPTLYLWYGTNGNGVTVAGDKFAIIDGSSATTMSRQSYAPDNSHAPDPFTVNYLITGDFWYLEECWFLASYLVAYLSPTTQRGPLGWYGGCQDSNEPRDQAWPMRQRFHAWSITPERFDDEKTYFHTMSMDGIEVAEGIRSMPSPRAGGTLYNWAEGRKTIAWFPTGTPPPLHNFTVGLFWGMSAGSAPYIDWTVTERMAPAWMHNYMLLVYAEAVDLGLPAEYVRAWGAQYLIDRIVGGEISPFSVAGYYEPSAMVLSPPVAAAPRTALTSAQQRVPASWAEVLAGFNEAHANYDFETVWNSQKTGYDPTHNYAFIGYAAAALCYDETDGADCWDWFVANADDAAGLARWSLNTRWRFKPRTLAYPE